MKRNMMRLSRLGKYLFLLLLITWAMPLVCQADPLSRALQNWEPMGIYGRIMEMGADGSSLVINEKTVLLVNQKRFLKVYRTKILDLEGKDLPLNVLSKGKYVAVKGAQSYEDKTNNPVVVAKEIYLLPKRMSRNELKQVDIFRTNPTKW